MATQTNNAGELVRQGRLNTGAAQVLQGPQSDPLGAFYKARDYVDPKAAAKVATRKAEDESWDKLGEFDRPKAYEIFNQEIYNDVADFREWTKEAKTRGGAPTSGDKIQAKNFTDAIEMKANYNLDVIDTYFRELDSAVADGEYDMVKIKDKYNQLMWGENQKGERVPRRIFNMRSEDFLAAKENSENFDRNKIWNRVLKTFPQMVGEYINENSDEFATATDKQTIKSSLQTYTNGIVDTDENGFPIINMDIDDKNDLAKKVLMGDAKVRMMVEDGRAAGLPEAKIWEDAMTMLKSQVGISISKKVAKSGEGGGNANFNAEVSDFVKRPHNVINESGEKTMIDTNIMRVVTLGGKFMDKKVDISSGGAYNIGEGKVDEGWVGSRKMSIMELQYVPWNNDPRGKKGKQLEYTEGMGIDTTEGENAVERLTQGMGHVVHLSQEEFNRKQLTNKYYGGRWMAQAQYLDEDLNKHEYLIPYDQVRGKIREMTKTAKNPGYDLFNTPLYQRSDNEIIDYLKKEYDYTVFGDKLLDLLMKVKENEIP